MWPCRWHLPIADRGRRSVDLFIVPLACYEASEEFQDSVGVMAHAAAKLFQYLLMVSLQAASIPSTPLIAYTIYREQEMDDHILKYMR
jgi:hypothetical protein